MGTDSAATVCLQPRENGRRCFRLLTLSASSQIAASTTMNIGTHVSLRTTPRAEQVWELPAPLMELAKISSCQPGECIYYQYDRAEYWYQLRDGAARKTAITPDGRRHIVSFLLPGDLFGFGCSREHQFSAEVISPRTIVARYLRGRAEQLAESDPAVSRCVREAAFESIAHLQARMIMLGRNSALEKVAAFLLEMRIRVADRSGVIDLPMSRYDIADYLSVAVETVSRSLTIMRGTGVIDFDGIRRLTIVNLSELKRMAGADCDDVVSCDLDGWPNN